MVNAPRGNSTYSQGLRSNLLGQDAGRPGYRERTRDHQSQPQHNSLDAEIAALTDEDILRQLHQELTDLSNERDMLKQTAAFLIEEAQK
ncbi:hypothetical protein MYSI104531_27365 [Mycobacterium simiae]